MRMPSYVPKLAVLGNVKFIVQKMRRGNEITSAMPSGEFVIDGVVVPFVLRKVFSSKIQNLETEPLLVRNVAVAVHEQKAATAFAKGGYVNIHIEAGVCQIWVYIKRECLGDFFSAICMGSVKD
jgi:hypothetical protein